MTRAILLVPPSPALPLGQILDRPFIQHAIEQLTERGIRDFHLLLQGQPEVASFLGDGARWGVTLRYSPVEGSSAWSELAATNTAVEGDDLVLVGDASLLPCFPVEGSEGAPAGGRPAIYFDENAGITRWSGWALLRPADIATFAGAVAASGWRHALRSISTDVQMALLDRPSLGCADARQILMSNRCALEGQYPGLFFTGKQIRPGVWTARAVKLPASARIQAPCYIGEESSVGNDCELGPHAVIGPGCCISPGTSISRSVVAEATYLGPGLEVMDSFVQNSVIHNVRLDTRLHIAESHIAGEMRATGFLSRLRF